MNFDVFVFHSSLVNGLLSTLLAVASKENFYFLFHDAHLHNGFGYFTLYNANFAIVRTVVVGFAVMGMLTYFRILFKEHVNSESFLAQKWMKPLAIMIVFSVLMGILAPKF